MDVDSNRYIIIIIRWIRTVFQPLNPEILAKSGEKWRNVCTQNMCVCFDLDKKVFGISLELLLFMCAKDVGMLGMIPTKQKQSDLKLVITDQPKSLAHIFSHLAKQQQQD